MEEYLAFQIKNRINIKQLISIRVKQNNIVIKLRFEENISKYHDDNEINISVYNQLNKKIEVNKLIKVGNKTLSVKLNINKPEEFIKHINQNDLKICVAVNGELHTKTFEDIDKDIIFFNLIDRIRYSRKYKKLCKVIYKKLFLKLPMNKNTIMFESFLGRNCSGNPKYIYEYLVSNGLDKKYKLIWILNNTDENINGNYTKVKRRSLKYYYHMATSRYWIFNCRQAKEMVKRKGNVYLQTWHGTPLKKLGMDMDNVNMAGQNDINKYKEEFRENSSTWDYLISQNHYSTEIFRRAFVFNKKMLDYGYPANDILYTKNNEHDINEIKEKLNIPKGKKTILYAPTWRDDNFLKKGYYKMSIQLELDQMQKALGDEYVVLLRMHYLIMNTINIEKYKDFVYNLSEGYDIQELYLVSDILITDYSSVMFDYSNLRRSIIFFAYDIENYRDSLRGFYFDFENEAPGPIVKTTEEVIDSINNIDNINNEYKCKQESFYNKFCHIDDGSAAERIIKHILK